MGKSRAEIQRAYRQRLKEKNNAEYLRNERERMRRNYVPSASLSENDRKRRNDKNKAKLRRFYQRQKQARAANASLDNETSGYESESGRPSTSQNRGRLRVRLEFPNNRRKGALRRWKRELSEANSRIRLLEQEREKLVKKVRSTQRSLQRSKNKKQPVDMTPRKETEKLMDDANLSETQRKKIRKPLLLGNALCKEIKESSNKASRRHKKVIHSTLSGKIVKKYRVTQMMSKKTGLCRHRLSKVSSKYPKDDCRLTRKRTVEMYRNEIIEFMTREDNSRLQPGKADAKSIQKGEKAQTYVLSDYLLNLYQKFIAENTSAKISFASFCRARPKYILTAAFSSRRSCLCLKHQNAAQTIKALRKVGVEVPANPEKVVQQLPDPQLIKDSIGEELIALGQWKRVEVEERGKKKNVTKLIERQMGRDEFVLHFQDQMRDFSSHVDRVHAQYEQIRILKKKLPEHEIIVQVDFAENYSCKSVEEPLSAYYNQTAVTLHPMVAYYRLADGTLGHKSFITISDEMAHRSSTVIAFIEDIMPTLRQLDGNLQKIHYWSDSPTSQYRNKYMFDFVANHQQRFEVAATWNYFEAGHGKGPCDGLGGTCKRLADEAMRAGKVIIQDASAFHAWAVDSTMKNVTFRFVPSSKCQEVQQIQEKRKFKAIKGTLKVHAVVGQGHSNVCTRETSCYCETCLQGQTCYSWQRQRTSAEENQVDHGVTDSSQRDTEADSQPVARESVPVAIGDYVAAVYEGMWYIGAITDKDETECEVDFMQMKKDQLQWPRQKDKLWLANHEILCVIAAPEATGKFKRMFNLSKNDEEVIRKRFSEYEALQ